MNKKIIFNKLASRKTNIFLYKYYNQLSVKNKNDFKKNIFINIWLDSDKPIPPPHAYKVSIIKQYALLHRIHLLIETGTFLGATILACEDFFRKLISIELDNKLYQNARIVFAAQPKIILLQGDSGELLGKTLAKINERCLFWLDGHYSEGITAKGKLNTPIVSELAHIFNHSVKNHVILIDDARCFTGKHDYPTIDELKSIVKKYNPKLKFKIVNDIIRIH